MLRKTFRNSGRKLGITFTAPSGMIEYVDRINAVSHLEAVMTAYPSMGMVPSVPMLLTHTPPDEIRPTRRVEWFKPHRTYCASPHEGFNQEVINMDLYMPEFKGIKAIWDEFWPFYQDLVAQKAADWVLHAYNSIANRVTPEMAAQGGPLGKLMRTAKHYSQTRNRLN